MWNKDLDFKVNGIRFKSVYEISDFKIDRFNVIGSIEIEDLKGYDRGFVTNCENEPEIATIVSIELVAGGNLNMICSGAVELMRC